MSYTLLWIFLLILQSFTVSYPLPNQYDLGIIGPDQEPMNNGPNKQRYGELPNSSDEKVISVRITSSVAVGRGNGKSTRGHSGDMNDQELKHLQFKVAFPEEPPTTVNTEGTDVPPNLVGANIEYIKQLNAKKESRDHNSESMHPFQLMANNQHNSDEESLQTESSTRIDNYEEDTQDIPLARKVPSTANANRFDEQKTNRRYPTVNSPVEAFIQNHPFNVTTDSLFEPFSKLELGTKSDDRYIGNLTASQPLVSDSNNYQNDDSIAESSIKSVEFAKYNARIGNIPPTVTMQPVHSPNNVQGLANRPLNGRNSPSLTTVSFNIVHDTPRTTNDNEPSNSFISSSQIAPNENQFYTPPKIYSQPSQIYSEPAKFYSEPAKIYSEPAKIYSEPAKVYSEPAKIYSEPSKFYSEPASLHLNQNVPSSIPPNYSPWQRNPQTSIGSTTMNTTPVSTVTNVFQRDSTIEQQPEKNYEIDEKLSVLTEGRSHGVQETTTEKCKQENCKVGYVVEGRQFKKYRVEERTPDGFIVGEYGVVRNEDGALRGVRYTADSDASPRLIHDALMKFLQLK